VAISGTVGLPVPGVSLKLAPFEGKLEARFRGPNVTPGYWRDPGRTAAAFDAEGYFCSGDALAFVDPDDVALGLRFDGRLTEDFKLLSGTWVSVGPLRARIVDALQPWVRDIVVAGADRDSLGILALPSSPDVVSDPEILAAILARLRALNTGGNATRVQRFAFLTAPLSIDHGELTDKGSLNQRAILARHAALVEALYADPPPEGVHATPG
jgi:feruloyl-CoA synthase